MVTLAYKRLLLPQNSSFFLFGMRGVGKSTWVKQHFKKSEVIDLLDEDEFQKYLRDPNLLYREFINKTAKTTIVIDEIQRVPALLNQVHRLMSEKKITFILLGSSARKLRHSGINLLGGRAGSKTMYPLLPEELDKDFKLESLLENGSVPLIVQASDKKEALKGYVSVYLKEEIRAESLVRNLPGFVRFMPIAGMFHGKVLSISNIARESETARTTVQGYIEILEDTLMAKRLPAFEAKIRTRERSHPKLYWVDSGVARAVQGIYGTIQESERGALLEGHVHTLLNTYNEIYDLYDEIFYWSSLDAKNVEIDFLLKKGGKHIAIEVKSTKKFNNDLLNGLKASLELKSVKRRVLVYLGSRSFVTDGGIEVVAYQDFLSLLEREELWDS